MIEPVADELTIDEDRDVITDDVPEESVQRRVYTNVSDPTIGGLYASYKSGDLDLRPDFQRYFVWDSKKSSRLIESVFLDVPLPAIYLAEEVDGSESVIDGQQRLTSFFTFLDGTLALNGLDELRHLNGKRFGDLDKPLQAKIRKASIRAITIRKESHEDLKFEIFERLNSGSVALNDQELRNCIYRGNYNTLLRELANDPDFMFILGIQRPEKRMRDIELVLRFAAFYHAGYLNYSPPIRRFLNEDMNRYKTISEKDASALRTEFKKSVQLIRSLLGSNAFKRYYKGDASNPNGGWEQKRFNASLFDILMYGFTRFTKNQVYPYLDSIYESYINLLTSDGEFVESIELSTSSRRMVTLRFDKWRHTLENTIGFPTTEPRIFTHELKEEMFTHDPTCAICKQRIQDVDDAALDHIDQYWRGGRTIPENARLAHRFCNWSRPQNDIISSDGE